MQSNQSVSVFEKLDFDYVLQLVRKEFAIVDNELENLSQNSDAEQIISTELTHVKEIMAALEERMPIHYDGIVDFRNLVLKISKQSREFEFEEFVHVYNGIKLCSMLQKWIAKGEHRKNYPQLYAELSLLDSKRFVFTKAIEEVIDFKKLEIKSDASKELVAIRKRRSVTEKRFQKIFGQLLKKYNDRGVLAESGEGVHSGRRVLAVNATFKNQINGMVVSSSNSGNIVFVHDNSVLPILNDFSQIDAEERVEIKRILHDLANNLLENRTTIELLSLFVLKFDRWLAKSKFGLKYSCSIPQEINDEKIEVKEARHPKLFDKIENKDDLIPVNLSLNNSQRIMVISGPNAGGKSVALKTFGTMLLMLNFAIPIPVHEKSKLRIFPNIFADIGDDQSIQDDLSTYSSHLTKMSTLSRQKSSKTLFLIDEFGKGTDPALGGPIASAILETLNKRKFWGVVTTHYTDLKELAQEEHGMVNAAMTFDKQKLQPTYELVKGLPGSSFAFEIASKVGFSEEVLNRIIKNVGTSKSALEKNLGDIQTEKQFIKNLRKEVQKKNEHLDRLLNSYQTLKKELEKKQKNLEKTYDQKLLDAYNNANRELENLIRTSKEKDRVKLKEKRKDIDKKRKQLSDQLMLKDQQKTLEVLQEKIKVGDNVILEGNDHVGIVQQFRKNKVIVQFGKITYNLPLNKLQKVKEDDDKVEETNTYANKGSKEIEAQSQFNCVLDLRGLYKAEALKLTEQFLDRAILFNIEKLHIVHGRGRGTIREMVQNYLKTYPHVKKYGKADRENGGDGVTEVFL